MPPTGAQINLLLDNMAKTMNKWGNKTIKT